MTNAFEIVLSRYPSADAAIVDAFAANFDATLMEVESRLAQARTDITADVLSKFTTWGTEAKPEAKSMVAANAEAAPKSGPLENDDQLAERTLRWTVRRQKSATSGWEAVKGQDFQNADAMLRNVIERAMSDDLEDATHAMTDALTQVGKSSVCLDRDLIAVVADWGGIYRSTAEAHLRRSARRSRMY